MSVKSSLLAANGVTKSNNTDMLFQNNSMSNNGTNDRIVDRVAANESTSNFLDKETQLNHLVAATNSGSSSTESMTSITAAAAGLHLPSSSQTASRKSVGDNNPPSIGNSAAASKRAAKKVQLRKGKWTDEEELFTKKLIDAFNNGVLLNVSVGTTLRSFLSEKLWCDPMRITKKFAGSSCIGKQVFSPCENSDVNRKRSADTQVEIDCLEEKFLAKLEPSLPSHLVLAGRGLTSCIPANIPSSTPYIPRSFEDYSPELLVSITHQLQKTNAGSAPPMQFSQEHYISRAQQQQHWLQQYEKYQAQQLQLGFYQGTLSFAQVQNATVQPLQQMAVNAEMAGDSSGSDKGGRKTDGNSSSSSGNMSTSGEETSENRGEKSSSSSASSHYSASSMRSLQKAGHMHRQALSDSSDESDRPNASNDPTASPAALTSTSEQVVGMEFLAGPKKNAVRRKRGPGPATVHESAANSPPYGGYRGGYSPQTHNAQYPQQEQQPQQVAWSRNQARIDIAKNAASAAAAGMAVSQVDLDASDLLLNFFKSANAGGESPTSSLDRNGDKDGNSGDEGASDNSGENRNSTVPSGRSSSQESEGSRSSPNSDMEMSLSTSGSGEDKPGGSGTNEDGSGSGSSEGEASSSKRAKRRRDETHLTAADEQHSNDSSHIDDRTPSESGSNEAKSDPSEDEDRSEDGIKTDEGESVGGNGTKRSKVSSWHQ